MKQNSTKEILTITLKLLVICSVVAVIVAFVYGITKDRIALNEMMNTATALTEIYSEDFGGHPFEVKDGEFAVSDADGNTLATCSVAECEYIKDVTALYELCDADGNSLGYCVAIQPLGFKDVIKMLVAVNADLTVKGVKIVAMSETSGIGTKAQDASYLAQFTGRDAESSLQVDTIAGATKTTKPVIEAVSNSVNQVIKYINEKGGMASE